MRPLALITGAAGLIGTYLLKTAPRWAPRWDVRGLTRGDVDLIDVERVTDIYRTLQPQVVIHCAALSRTKDCEQQPETARVVNVAATAHLATCAKNIPFFFLSSGEVFDGKKGWYEETDETGPINVYGKTKLEAEQTVLQNPLHTVVRIVLTAGTSRSRDRSFVEEMSSMAKSGGRLTLFEDEYRCPLPAGVIARALWELLDCEQPGLYHLGGRDRLSRREIGESLVRWYPELTGRLESGTARTYTGSPRPVDLSLRCDKIQRLLSFQIPGFLSWLTSRAEAGADLWDYPDDVREA